MIRIIRKLPHNRIPPIGTPNQKSTPTGLKIQRPKADPLSAACPKRLHISRRAVSILNPNLVNSLATRIAQEV